MILDPRFWLALVFAGLLGYGKGRWDTNASAAKAQTKAIATARETEQEIRRYENKASAAYLARMLKQQEKARALPKITIPHDCPVPADIGRVLNDAQQLSTDAATGPSPGATSPTTDSTCAAELDIAKRNYAEVCIPNAEQLTELQKRWEETRKRISTNGTTP